MELVYYPFGKFAFLQKTSLYPSCLLEKVAGEYRISDFAKVQFGILWKQIDTNSNCLKIKLSISI